MDITFIFFKFRIFFFIIKSRNTKKRNEKERWNTKFKKNELITDKMKSEQCIICQVIIRKVLFGSVNRKWNFISIKWLPCFFYINFKWLLPFKWFFWNFSWLIKHHVILFFGCASQKINFVGWSFLNRIN